MHFLLILNLWKLWLWILFLYKSVTLPYSYAILIRWWNWNFWFILLFIIRTCSFYSKLILVQTALLTNCLFLYVFVISQNLLKIDNFIKFKLAINFIQMVSCRISRYMWSIKFANINKWVLNCSARLTTTFWYH
jgi:hypothetical protein